jgi:hypothetical protein
VKIESDERPTTSLSSAAAGAAIGSYPLDGDVVFFIAAVGCLVLAADGRRWSSGFEGWAF